MRVEIKLNGLDTSDKAVRERNEDSFHQLYMYHPIRKGIFLHRQGESQQPFLSDS